MERALEEAVNLWVLGGVVTTDAPARGRITEEQRRMRSQCDLIVKSHNVRVIQACVITLDGLCLLSQ